MNLSNKYSDIEFFQVNCNGTEILQKKLNDQYQLIKNNTIFYESDAFFSFYELKSESIFLIQHQTKKNLLIDLSGREVDENDYDINLSANYTLYPQLKISFVKLKEVYFPDYSALSEAECFLFENLVLTWKIKYVGRLNFYNNKIILKFPNPDEDGNNVCSPFSKVNFTTGEMEWNFDLDQHSDKLVSAYPFDQPLQVQEPLGVYKDQLWFSMSNYGLLCLNNNTGEFTHYLRDCPENPAGHIYLPYGGYPVIPFTENAVLLAEEGKIVGFDNMFYWQLDLETLELDFHFLEDYFKEVDCYTFRTRFKKLIVEGRKIYMVASKSNKFACFNRDTLKYDWIESLPENSGSPRSIEKHGDKLYIDTSKKELLVYEM